MKLISCMPIEYQYHQLESATLPWKRQIWVLHFNSRPSVKHSSVFFQNCHLWIYIWTIFWERFARYLRLAQIINRKCVSLFWWILCKLKCFYCCRCSFCKKYIIYVFVSIFRKLLVHVCDSLGTLTLYRLDFQYIWLSIWGGLSLLTLCAWWNGISWVLPFWK